MLEKEIELEPGQIIELKRLKGIIEEKDKEAETRAANSQMWESLGIEEVKHGI